MGPDPRCAKLFAGNFVTIIPVLAMPRAAHDGAVAPLIGPVTATDGKSIDAMYV